MAPVKWEHPDGRTIEVWDDRKVRMGFVWPDEAPVVYRGWRYAMTYIPDSQWYASPGPDWRAA
jgi:hypothetical protein